MGCDIHLFVEAKDPATGEWKSADKWTPNEYYDPEDGISRKTAVAYRDRFYSGRNYNLFAILADVRNGVGFAGVETGKGFVPIAPQRNLPEDASPEARAESDGWGADGHSHSYLTVQEIMDFDWTQTTTLYGTVTAAEYYKWTLWNKDEGRAPDSYSGGVFGANVVNVIPEEMESLIEQEKAEISKHEGWRWNQLYELLSQKYHGHYTRISWETAYYQVAENFLGTVLPRLWRLGKPEDVRIVFWFDN